MRPLVALAVALLTACVSAGTPSSHAPIVAYVGATLVDGSGREPIPDAVVVVRGNRIAAAGARSSVTIPRDATIQGVAGLTIVPGLIDSHVHFGMTALTGPSGEPDLSTLREFLRHGVTSIRDPGDAYPWIVQLRDEIAAGRVEGPRIFAAGPTLTALGGHPAGTLLRGNAEAIATGTRQVTTADSARAAVRALADGGVDFIKAIYDGGSRRSPFGMLPKLDRDVLAAIVDEARARRIPVTVHWANTSELGDVIALAPDQIEHIGVAPIADSLVREIVAKRIVVDPTLAVYEKMLPDELFGSLSLASARNLIRAGVTITAGTDAPLGGLAFGASLHHELELLVKAGLTPNQAILAATRNAAVAMRKDGDIGTLEPGKLADFVVLGGDPLRSIADIRHVRIVVKDGRMIQ